MVNDIKWNLNDNFIENHFGAFYKMICNEMRSPKTLFSSPPPNSLSKRIYN